MSKGVRPKGEKAKFVQIAVIGDIDANYVYALDEDGIVWCYQNQVNTGAGWVPKGAVNERSKR